MRDKWAFRTKRGFLAFYADRVEFSPRRGNKTPLVIPLANVDTWKSIFNGSLLIRLTLQMRDGGEFRFAFFFMKSSTLQPGLEHFPPN